MKRALLIAAALALASCTTKPTINPVPVVQYIEVKVPVAVPCDPDIGPEPAYADTPEAIAAATDLFARVQLLLAGRGLRIARDEVKTAALAECRGLPARPG